MPSPKKILLIDDERSICKFTKLNLERSGAYRVTVAYSGEEGLTLAQQDDFDLVITDFRMPGIDGKAVLDVLKAMKPWCPVVLFSVYHDDSSELSDDILDKADGIISKPIDHDRLIRVIEEASAKKGRRR
jgi:DNA-binding NtrC family response regulator